jgi:hypothetical protein
MCDRWSGIAIKDYVASPKRTGYRAIHAFVPANDRIVEVQLRTARQNRWADEVESAADRLGFRLKDGEGPNELVRYLSEPRINSRLKRKEANQMKPFSMISRIFGATSARTSRHSSDERKGTSYFLVLFDARHGRLLSQQQILDSATAMRLFNEAEKRHADDPTIQVVMFSADSIEAVQATHPHYFKGPGLNTDPFGVKPVAAAH